MLSLEATATIGLLVIGGLIVCLLFALVVTVRSFAKRESDRRGSELDSLVRKSVEDVLGDRMEEFEYRQFRQRELLEERLDALLKKFGG